MQIYEIIISVLSLFAVLGGGYYTVKKSGETKQKNKQLEKEIVKKEKQIQKQTELFEKVKTENEKVNAMSNDDVLNELRDEWTRD